MKKKYLLRNILIAINIISIVSILISVRSFYVNPLENAWIPFFGLAFPFFLLLNIIFIIYWTWRKKRWYLMSLITLLLLTGPITNFFQINFFEKPTSEETDFRLMTFNVHLFGLYSDNNTKIRDDIFSYLTEEAADIMCFQEFYHTDNKNGFITRDKLLQIQGATNIHEKYTHVFRHKQNFGVVTLSKFLIVHRGYIPFDGDINNFCIFSDIELPSKDTVRIYNAHFSSIRFENEDYKFINGGNTEYSFSSISQGVKRIASRLQLAFEKRSVQVEKVLDNVKDSPHPTLLVGDFNDSPISYCYNKVSEQLHDSFISHGEGIGNTYNGSFPSFRIDYVFHSQELECQDFKIDRKDLSDHFPIVTSFKVK